MAFILQYLLLSVYYRAVHSDTPPWLLSAKNGWSSIEFVEGLGILFVTRNELMTSRPDF